jgi:hypothetical protein
MVNASHYREILGRTADYLTSYRDAVWAPRLEAWLNDLDRVKTNGDLRGHAERSRAATFGMGSLGDFSITPGNGHAIAGDRKEIGAASSALWSLALELYDESDRLLRELSEE